MDNLYTSLVLPQLEYAAPVWQIANCQPLQRKGLAVCLGLPTTSGKDAAEVLSGVLPLDFRREELSIRECGKIFAKNKKENIAKCLESYMGKHTNLIEKFRSPFGYMLTQIEDMKSLTNLTMNSIEPEFSYLEYLQPSRTRPDYWNNLGCSESRTNKQVEDAKQIIKNIPSDVDNRTAVAFTDGSCRGNPGPCGAGACILLPNTELVELKQPVSKLSSILVGEMVAIKIKLKTILEECKRLQIKKLKIFSHSQSAIGIINLGWENKTHKFLSSEILQLWKDLEMAGVDIHLDWTLGHAGISGNETADRLAKEAATEAESMTDDEVVTSQADICHVARESVRMKWQRRWDISENGRHLYQFRQEVKPKYINFQGLKNQKILLQLQWVLP
ncbi:uncharacterized protein LOC123564567 [Mercenaria mercenaria]|uniref:uncharacterized protein LOC123564567 n=1 Tax=Mercenaria mercenaria TaxID=6596 RepID=UPI001E1D2400|nr:uncharacterized protein LOC123564567 [Mercenaria mercenaria]